ncbi:DUF2254 domain-containing protein [Pseudonocardia acidicola]|uniref:DUF2254 domain-containing protein n=1 Tax=Pseudonocardia acidicola TaxID=2724939 RepID=UPI001B7D0875
MTRRFPVTSARRREALRTNLWFESEWRREALRTNLWFVPTLEVLAATALFAATVELDRAVYDGILTSPSWMVNGTADAARQILTTIAAAVITVVGIVFSITIVTLTLASTQFGPRMLRNFIRDRGTQVTLGTFVATFVYAILVLVSISPGRHGDFVPHISILVSFVLAVADLAVLIYFINHIANQIQLPHVIAGIAKDLSTALEAQSADSIESTVPEQESGPSVDDLIRAMDRFGGVIATPASGYLQFIRHRTLVGIAAEVDAVIHLPYRPGHFMVRGHPLAVVLPAAAAAHVGHHLERAQVIGPYRMLTQDVSFGLDQLVEIALRALSSAVNDTFTALTCIDWLGDCLCKIANVWRPNGVHRDRHGFVRVISDQASYDRLVERSFEKIRQAGHGMPAVMIRQLDALAKIMEQTSHAGQKQVLLDQATKIRRACLSSVSDESDRADVDRRYEALVALDAHLVHGAAASDREGDAVPPPWPASSRAGNTGR